MGHHDLVGKVRLPVCDSLRKGLTPRRDVTLLCIRADDDPESVISKMAQQPIVPQWCALWSRRQIS